MRIFLIVLVLILSIQSLSKAEDLSEFEIEGMSVGDSLLNFFSKKEIEEGIFEDYPASDKYKRVQNDKLPFFKTYDAVDFRFKTKSKNFIIESLSGIILYKRNFDRCFDKQKEIVNELTYIQGSIKN